MITNGTNAGNYKMEVRKIASTHNQDGMMNIIMLKYLMKKKTTTNSHDTSNFNLSPKYMEVIKEGKQS